VRAADEMLAIAAHKRKNIVVERRTELSRDTQ
jgi:hypothetical protein